MTPWHSREELIATLLVGPGDEKGAPAAKASTQRRQQPGK